MKNYLLEDLTKEEFENNRGKTFSTAATNKSPVVTRYPTVKGSDGKEYYSTVSFDTYEEYLEYIKPTF